MASNHEACEKCARTCLLVHKNGETSKAPVTFFFKVMTGGAQFFQFLPLPPTFAATVRNLIGQETFLENSGGRRWRVKFSLVEGSLGFKKGWSVFAVDNRLELGDFVMFNYIEGSHFFVQVCDNTACEKPYSSVSSNQKKGTTATEKTPTAKNGPGPSVDKGKLKKQGTSRCVTPEPDSEVRKRHSKGKGLRKLQEVTEDIMYIETSSEDEFTVEQSYAAKRGKSRELQREEFDLPTLESLRNNQRNGGSRNLTVGRKKHHPKKVAASSKSTRKDVSDSESWDAVLAPEPLSTLPPLGSNFPSGCTYNTHGATGTVCRPSTRAHKVPCSTEAGGQPFLVLPTPLPLFDNGYEPKRGSETRVVILRDEHTKLWPVFYDASSSTLMKGWEAFRKANKIQPRDMCTFYIQDGAKNTWNVGIDRN